MTKKSRFLKTVLDRKEVIEKERNERYQRSPDALPTRRDVDYYLGFPLRRDVRGMLYTWPEMKEISRDI